MRPNVHTHQATPPLPHAARHAQQHAHARTAHRNIAQAANAARSSLRSFARHHAPANDLSESPTPCRAPLMHWPSSAMPCPSPLVCGLLPPRCPSSGSALPLPAAARSSNGACSKSMSSSSSSDEPMAAAAAAAACAAAAHAERCFFVATAAAAATSPPASSAAVAREEAPTRADAGRRGAISVSAAPVTGVCAHTGTHGTSSTAQPCLTMSAGCARAAAQRASGGGSSPSPRARRAWLVIEERALGPERSP